MTVIPMPLPADRPRRRYTATERLNTAPLAMRHTEDPTPCAKHPDLPWVPEPSANIREQLEMRGICYTCPIIAACARHAVQTGPVGFYAGTWIPGMGRGRSKALADLRRIAGGAG